MTTMTSVTEILNTVRYSVDFGDIDDYEGETEDDRRTALWEDLLRTKSSDTGFGALVAAILANGFDRNSPIGWDTSDYSINEGHHRLAAAILLGMDEIPTTPYGGGSGVICAHDCACNGEDYDQGGLLGHFDLD